MREICTQFAQTIFILMGIGHWAIVKHLPCPPCYIQIKKKKFADNGLK
ncbi:hypothetical protein GXM_07862 [Nostoc sphaeroides CCNUC1]|uniref:Uncharacterized protein n=1 Tax=Nostoc sphaeroides CCNUC1 TaxID=2653204 RepID=A0A5P8WC95_9NOSO|nr:hypothetical protein GXM_07862 [Nostoc sphaeroides CCNUC1]